MRCKLLFIIWTPTLFNYILVVILIFYRISDCVESGYDYEQFGWEKPCKMLEITEECLRSINGNCTIDFFEDLSQLQQMCDQKKSGGCSEYHNWA